MYHLEHISNSTKLNLSFKKRGIFRNNQEAISKEIKGAEVASWKYLLTRCKDKKKVGKWDLLFTKFA